MGSTINTIDIHRIDSKSSILIVVDMIKETNLWESHKITRKNRVKKQKKAQREQPSTPPSQTLVPQCRESQHHHLDVEKNNSTQKIKAANGKNHAKRDRSKTKSNNNDVHNHQHVHGDLNGVELSC